MANPIKIVADVTFDDRQIQQAGQSVAKPALGRVADGLAKTAKPFSLLITADASNAEQLVQQFAAQVDTSLSGAESKVQSFGKTLAGIGVGGLGVGALLTSIGSGEQQASQQLDAAITAAGQSVDDFEGRIKSAQSTEEGFAHTHEDTDRALQITTQSYGDTGAALNRLQLETDLAAAKHESLADAATQVARVHGGATRVLKEFNVQVGTNADGSKNLEGALDELSKKLDGQANASVDTFTGHLKVLGTEVKDQVATFGQDYGPLILGVSTGVTALGGAISGASSLASRFRTATDEGTTALEAQTIAQSELAGAIAETATAETDLGGTTATVTALMASSSGELDTAAVQRLVSNQALKLSDLDVQAAQAAHVLSNEALIASEDELDVAYAAQVAAATEAAAANDSASTAAYIAAEGVATEELSMSALLGPIGLAVAGIGALVIATGGLDWGTNVQGAKDYANALAEAAHEAGDLATNEKAAVDTTTAQKLGMDSAAKAAVTAGISWQTLGNEVRQGSEDLGSWERVAQSAANTGNTSAQANHQLADSLRAAGAGATQFGQGLISALESGKLNTVQTADLLNHLEGLHNGYTQAKGDANDQKAALDGITGSAGDAAGTLDQVTAAEAKIKADELKKLNDALSTARDNADKAFSAILRLAPANIRAQQGQLVIADDQQRVLDAQQKLDDLRRGASADDISAAERTFAEANLAVADAQQKVIDAQNKLNGLRAYGGSAADIAAAEEDLQKAQLGVGDAQKTAADDQKKLNDLRTPATPEQLAQAERDLQSAQLDVQQATLDQAQALTDLQTAQDAANGKTDDANTQTQNYATNLGDLAGQFNGVTRNALLGYAFNVQVGIDKTKELEREQQLLALGLSGVATGALSPAFGGGSGYDAGRPGDVPGGRGRAAGGWVQPHETFPGAERGWELAVLPKMGTYQAPSSGMFVIPHDASEAALSGLGGGSRRPSFNVEQLVITAPDAVAGANRLPDALAIEAHLAGV